MVKVNLVWPRLAPVKYTVLHRASEHYIFIDLTFAFQTLLWRIGGNKVPLYSIIREGDV